MNILPFLRKVKKSFDTHQALIEVQISKRRLIGNYNEYVKKYPSLSFAPVLKSNAYGHGLVQVAQCLDHENSPFFAVDSYFEARALRVGGIRKKILVIGYTQPENILTSKLGDTAFTITGIEQLKEISRTITTPLLFHLKIDTGMHRQGITEEEVAEAVEIINKNKKIQLEGVCSHFADADGEDRTFSEGQVKKWNRAAEIIKNKLPSIKYFHLSASAGVVYLNNAHSNVVRLGLGLYGISPSPFLNLDLKPALKMQSLIASVKKIMPGDAVGYSLTYRADKETKVAVVPAGYFEGVDRRLSNRGFFVVSGKPCPIIGRVSMNITCIDVSEAGKVAAGDPVIIVSDNKEDENSVENMAKIAGTIPYEILIHIPQHLKRTVVGG
ncbi:MAG: alanine racemase [Candidatus Liptonbacteria bacterium]